MSPKVFSEELRAADQLHGGVVHEHVIDLDFRIFRLHFAGDLAPQAGGLQHVGLVHDREVLPAPAGVVEGQAEDALDLGTGVDAGVIGRVPAVLPSLLAEIHAAGEFPDAEEIGPVHEFGLQRGLVHEGLEGLHRTEVGVEPQLLADGQQSLLRPHFRRGVVVVFRVAHGAEQHGVARHAEGMRLGRIGIPAAVDGACADITIGIRGLVAEFPADGVSVSQCSTYDTGNHMTIVPNAEDHYLYVVYYKSTNNISISDCIAGMKIFYGTTWSDSVSKLDRFINDNYVPLAASVNSIIMLSIIQNNCY